MALLRILKGPQAGAQFALGPDEVFVGSDAACGIVLADPRVAPKHAAIRLDGGRRQVNALSADAGTFVNGARVEGWTDVGPDDHLRVGGTFLTIDESAEGVAAPATCPAACPAPPPAGSPDPAPAAPAPPPAAAPAAPADAAPTPPAAPPGARATAPPTAGVPDIPGCSGTTAMPHGVAGSLYAARQIAHARDVAIRVFDGDPKHAARLAGLALQAADLAHVNLVAVHETGETAGLAWAITERQHGGSLADLVRTEGPDGLPWREAVRLVKLAAAGLAHVHEKGMVHGAVRPSNVLLGRERQAKLGAPGVEGDARSGASDAHYMSPEQARGERKLTAQADVWALGATLYFALTGRTPHVEETAGDADEILGRIAFSPPRPIEDVKPGLPPELCAAVRAMLAGERAARPASVEDAVRLLPSTADAPAAAAAAAPRFRKFGLREGVGIGVAAVVALGFLVSLAIPRLMRRDVAAAAAPEAELTESQKRLASILAREKELGPLTEANVDRWHALGDDCARLASEGSIDDPAVAEIWRHRRGIARQVCEIEGDDAETRHHVDVWMSGLTAASNELSEKPGPMEPREFADLVISLTSERAAAEQLMDAGKLRAGFDRMSAWYVTERALARRRKAREADWSQIQAGSDWLRAMALLATMRARADLVVDVEILRAHLGETTCLDTGTAGVSQLRFSRSKSRLAAIEALLVTRPGRDRAAERRATLDAQAESLAAVYTLAPLEPDRSADDPWRAALVKSVESAYDRLAAGQRAAALLVLCEIADAERVAAMSGRIGKLAEADRDRVRAEAAAVAQFEKAADVSDSKERAAALAEWIVAAAPTDASHVLSARVPKTRCREKHPVVTAEAAKEWLDWWGECEPGSAPENVAATVGGDPATAAAPAPADSGAAPAAAPLEGAAGGLR